MKYAALLMVLALAHPAHAAIWYVDTHVVGGAGTGISWTDAFSDLQQALAVAQPFDEVWIANGQYRPTSTPDRTIAFEIPDDVAVYGGFAGGETDSSERDWSVNGAVLTGNIGSTVVDVDNSYNVVRTGARVTLDGLVVRDGVADGPSTPWRRGAGIYNTNDGVAIRNCLVTENRTGSGGQGGGLYTSGSDVAVEDCEISYNAVAGSFSLGGGAAAPWGDATITEFRRVVFRGNTSDDDAGGLSNGSLAEDCSFIDNQSVGFGGGTQWTYLVSHCYFEGNSAGSGGGAAYGDKIIDSEFTQNSAGGGGAIYGASKTHRCFIHGNTAEVGGGVILSVGQIHNSVLYGNVATDSGGGLFGCSGCAAGSATNLTIVNNTASSGGGVASAVDMSNSIIWGNYAAIGPSFLGYGTGASTFNHCLIEGSNGSGPFWQLTATDAGGNIDANPLFADASNDDFHIGANSPAFGAGSNALVIGPSDADGQPRIQGTRVEMGAFETADAVDVTPAAHGPMLRAYPTPFNPRVTIEFVLPGAGRAVVTVYDATGRRVRTLFDGLSPASNRLEWDGTDDGGHRVATGVYFAHVDGAGFRDTTKLVLMK